VRKTTANNSFYAIVALGITINRISLMSLRIVVYIITMNTTTA
jgi:hypothetical protein